jgi:zinc transport system substrate-binding protein
MKKLIAIALAVIATVACLASCSAGSETTSEAHSDAPSDSKIHVVASFYPMYDFAKKIGGDRVEVTSLVPAGTEPHDWEPSTADMKALESAEVLVYSGAGMECWVEDIEGTLSNEDLISVEASQGVDLLPAVEHEDEEDGAEREDAHEHEHGQYDPHVWLSPENAKIEMGNIRDALVKADPEGKSTYDANYEKYAGMLDELDEEYREGLSNTTSKNIVVSHQAFGYLCNRYGLTQVPIEGIQADSEPDAKTMAEIVEFVEENNVKVIFSEELVSPKAAQSIADATGAECEVLNPLEGLTDEELSAGEDYFSVMESNLDKLVKALS